MPSESVVHVIDDDPAMRDSLEFLFDTAGMPVRAYDSAAAFLAVLADAPEGCVVTDVRMPEMSGIELLAELQARGSALPVIVITGHGDVPLAIEAMKAGAKDFLEKPFDDERLLGVVRAALEESGSHRGGSAGFRIANGRCCVDWSKASSTRPSPGSSASAPALSRSTGRS